MNIDEKEVIRQLAENLDQLLNYDRNSQIEDIIKEVNYQTIIGKDMENDFLKRFYNENKEQATEDLIHLTGAEEAYKMMKDEPGKVYEELLSQSQIMLLSDRIDYINNESYGYNPFRLHEIVEELCERNEVEFKRNYDYDYRYGIEVEPNVFVRKGNLEDRNFSFFAEFEGNAVEMYNSEVETVSILYFDEKAENYKDKIINTIRGKNFKDVDSIMEKVHRTYQDVIIETEPKKIEFHYDYYEDNILEHFRDFYNNRNLKDKNGNYKFNELEIKGMKNNLWKKDCLIFKPKDNTIEFTNIEENLVFRIKDGKFETPNISSAKDKKAKEIYEDLKDKISLKENNSKKIEQTKTKIK